MSTAIAPLGVGLSYRWELNPSILRHAQHFDWLELTPEHFLPLNADTLARLELLGRRFPLAAHSLELSPGSVTPPDDAYISSLVSFMSHTGCQWIGDHLCFTGTASTPLHSLTPLPFIEEAVEACVRNLLALRARFGQPLILENIAALYAHPISSLDEVSFVAQVLDRADCGWLLDLHNLYANARNHGFDPYRYLERAPLERVVQIHIAGGADQEGLRLDSHDDLTPPEVWRLLEYVVPRCPVRAVNFEMDSRFPPAEVLLEELGIARDILGRHGVLSSRRV